MEEVRACRHKDMTKSELEGIHFLLQITGLPAKIDLKKKWLPKQKTIQNCNIDAQRFRKTRYENPPTREIGVTS